MSTFMLPMREDQIATLDYSSKDLGHLGIVGTVCKEIDLAGEIDRIVSVDPRQKVTCGKAVVAMVLNALGFCRLTTLLISRVHGNKARRVTNRRRVKGRVVQ